MLASPRPPPDNGAHLRFCMYQTAGRATFTRTAHAATPHAAVGFLVALAKMQKKILAKFHQDGRIEMVQPPDVANKIGHLWITANCEVFGLDDYALNMPSLILELPVRPLMAVFRSSETMETLTVEFVDQGRLLVSAGSEYVTFTSTVHEIPVARLPAAQADLYFREPLIARPAITFFVPAIQTLHDKLARLMKYSSAVSVAANHDGRFACAVPGTQIQADLGVSGLQLITAGEHVDDPLELNEIQVSLESLVRVLGCTTAMQGQVACAIVPKETLIVSTKIPNPCGPDRPSGSITMILAAYDPN